MENDSYTDSDGDEDTQSGVSGRAIFEILSNLVLIFSASFGISSVHRWFGKVGCSLLFFKGFFGSMSLFDKCPDYVTLLYEEISLLCSALVIPLLCAEVCSEGGQQLKTVLIHLFYPLLQVGLDMFVDWPLEAHMIDISIALSVVVMSSFALSLRNLYGVMLACVYQISLCCMRKTRFDLSNLFVSLTCFHLLPNTLKSFQNSIQK